MRRLLILGIFILVLGGEYFATAKYVLHIWPYSIQAQRPPSFWKNQELKGSFIETQGFLKFEESDKKMYAASLKGLKEQYKNSASIKPGITDKGVFFTPQVKLAWATYFANN